MKFTLKEIAEKQKVSIATIKIWNRNGNRILNRLAMLELFIQETNFTKNDLEALKQLLQKKEKYNLKAEAKKVADKFQDYFWRAKNFELAAEFYALNFSIEELKAIYKLRKNL